MDKTIQISQSLLSVCLHFLFQFKCLFEPLLRVLHYFYVPGNEQETPGREKENSNTRRFLHVNEGRLSARCLLQAQSFYLTRRVKVNWCTEMPGWKWYEKYFLSWFYVFVFVLHSVAELSRCCHHHLCRGQDNKHLLGNTGISDPVWPGRKCLKREIIAIVPHSHFSPRRAAAQPTYTSSYLCCPTPRPVLAPGPLRT